MPLIEEAPNFTAPLIDKLEPLLQQLHGFIGKIEWFLGGLFGLYAIYFFFSIIKQRKEVKLLREIKQELIEIKSSVAKKPKKNAD